MIIWNKRRGPIVLAATTKLGLDRVIAAGATFNATPAEAKMLLNYRDVVELKKGAEVDNKPEVKPIPSGSGVSTPPAKAAK